MNKNEKGVWNASKSHALALADEDALKATAAKKRMKFLRQLRTAQSSLERFEEKDIPQFEQWKAGRFGSELSRIRELEEEARELAHLIDEVERERFFSRRPIAECYQNVLRWREHPEERPKPEGASGAGVDPRDFMKEFAKEMFGDIFGDDADFDDVFGDGPMFDEEDVPFGRKGGDADKRSGPEHAPARRAGNASSELKSSYRQLARKLHPDHREDLQSFDAKRLDALWHETQEAYASGNLEELERIDALIDIEVNGVGEETELERIEQAAEHHRRSLRAVERSIRQARKHPAWMFSKKSSVQAELEPFIAFGIEDALGDLESDLVEMRSIVASWTRPARKRSKRKAIKKAAKKAARERPKKRASVGSATKGPPSGNRVEAEQTEFSGDWF